MNWLLVPIYMADDQKRTHDNITPPDPVALGQAMVRIGEQSQKLMQDFMERQSQQPHLLPGDASSIMQAFADMSQQWMQQPAKMVEASFGLWQDYMKLWQNTAMRFAGEEQVNPIILPPQGDRRFQDRAWSESALFDYIKQSYLLSARWLQGMVRETEGLDAKTARKVDFYTRQFVDAMSPTNFLMTNPEVLRRTIETGGDNIVKGLEHLLDDLERGKGALKIAMTDEKAFEIGRDLANTPGKVIYQNDLMQLIQYEPMTDTVHSVPLLIIPPWINKYYILDLGERKSYVRYLLQQGYCVFMVSWVNPDKHLARKSFEDYMVEGPMAAMAEIAKATGQKNINIIGYCLGGTLLACMLAYLARVPKERVRLPFVNCATYLVTMLDFAEAGELSVFIDDEQLSAMETRMEATGYLDAQSMATTFNLLRANDLIWSFVVNNYLMGKEPFPFDLLYWNADSTRMPAAMHSFYLREMYQNNNLVKPEGIVLRDTSIDLREIDTPAFFLSTKDDHISPWRSTYAGALLMKGPVRFALSGSGHIAGVVNPPVAEKYGYMSNPKLPPNPETWLGEAVQHRGSWWPEWENWLRFFAGEKIPAQAAGASAPVIEEAPGSYVRVKAV
jgi:polyhydroxyalkanoate synthase